MKDFLKALFSRKTGEYLLSWKWVEGFFHWILTSGGTISSIVFLASGIWLSVKNSVPDFIQQYVNSDLANLLTYLSKTAFTALPEIILFLATLQTLDQIKLIRVSEKGSLPQRLAWTWAVLFGIPAVIFVGFALVNIGYSIASRDVSHLVSTVKVINGSKVTVPLTQPGNDYSMPDWIVVGRGLTCFIYALLVFIYESRGKDCFAKYVEEKKALITQITTDKDAEIAKLTSELEQVKSDFAHEKNELMSHFTLQIEDLTLQLNYRNSEVKKLAERASEASLQGLNHWDKSVINWIENADSTVGIDEITLHTGYTKRKIAGANLRTTGRNKERFYKDSVIDFLRKNKPNKSPNYVEIIEESNGNGHGQTEELEILSLPITISKPNNLTGFIDDMVDVFNAETNHHNGHN